MFKAVCDYLLQWSRDPAALPPATPEIAILALLLEIARADHALGDAERLRILQDACELLGVGEEQAARLVADAEARVEQSISLDDFTAVVNASLSVADRRRCLVAMWRVAAADGRIDAFEEAHLRKLCDLLHLSHSDFIKAKLAAGA